MFKPALFLTRIRVMRVSRQNTVTLIRVMRTEWVKQLLGTPGMFKKKFYSKNQSFLTIFVTRSNFKIILSIFCAIQTVC